MALITRIENKFTVNQPPNHLTNEQKSNLDLHYSVKKLDVRLTAVSDDVQNKLYNVQPQHIVNNLLAVEK